MENAPVELTLRQWLVQRAWLTPERVALRSSGRAWTWKELLCASDTMARRLATAGVQRGDRVAVLLRNGAPFVLLIHALGRLGAVLVPLNWRLTPTELAWQIVDSQASVLLVDRETSERLANLPVEGRRLVVLAVEQGTMWPLLNDVAEGTPALADEIDLQAIQSILYTSGTTGTPKGVVLTYGNHWWNAVGSALNLGIREDDCLLVVLPMFHVGGLAIILRSVIYGATAVVQERFEPAAVNRAIEDEGVTIVSVVAAMLNRMLDERDGQPYPATLRCVLLGGGPAPRPLLERCAQARMPVVQTYGLTESGSQAVTLAPQEALRKLGTAGKPLFPVQLAIRVGERAAAVGEIGEICLRGPSIAAGYWSAGKVVWRDPRAWLRTGDLGWCDAEGYLVVADRRDDLIISGGENVSPAEVEAVLLSHPDVVEAGVTGIADERWGQIPVAAVVVRRDAMVEEEGLRRFCAERLARYKVPRAIVIVDALPRTASGKVQRRLLRERSWKVGSEVRVVEKLSP